MITLVLLPIAINVGTGGTAPGPLQPLVGWLWPLVGVLLVIAVPLMVKDWRGGVEPLKAWKHPMERASSLARVEHYVRTQRSNAFDQLVLAELRLELSKQHDVVERPQAYNLDDPLQPLEALFTNKNIAAAFAEHRHRLLIRGAPGSGKTTLLLRLCLDLVEAARENDALPVPVLVNLASWSSSGGHRLPGGKRTPPMDFKVWLAEEVERHFRISAEQISALMREEEKLTVLLDGLDEVDQVYRERCVEEINALCEEGNVQIAVTSRVTEHQQLKTKIKLYDAFIIHPLERDEVTEFLIELGDNYKGVRSALAMNPRLWEMLTTPLVFSVMAVAYDKREAGETFSLSQLFDDYIVEMFVRRTGSTRWTPERVIRALRFLAQLARSPLWNDDVARTRLPAREAWSGSVTPSSTWRLFRRGEPGALAGLLASFSFALGTRFGMVVAVGAAVCAAWVMVRVSSNVRVVPRCSPEGRSGGWAWAAAGFCCGVMAGAAAFGVGLVLALVSDWSVFVGYALAAGLVVALALVTVVVVGPPLPRVCWGLIVVAVSVLVIWTGDVKGLLVGVGAGAGFGLVAGWLVAGLEALGRVRTPWLDWTRRLALPVSVSGVLLGIATAGLTGASAVSSIVPVVGVVLGLSCLRLVADSGTWVTSEVLAHYLAELLARPMTLDQVPLRKAALLEHAHQHILLIKPESEYEFVHRLVRDHLACCDPVHLGEEVSRRLRD